MATPIYYDSHMHTPLCKHAVGEPDDYAAQAETRGLKGIIFTCHNPTENNAYAPHVRMESRQFDNYVALVERARQAWSGRVDIRLGLECDYVPGHESWLEWLLAQAELNYVLGSIHPQLSEYKAAYLNGDPFEYQRTYFELLARSAESGLFDALSHPDLVKNETVSAWDLDRIMPAICDALDRIAATGAAMELNTSGLSKNIREMNPGRAMLAEMQARGIPVVIGSDAHQAGRVGADFELALNLLDSAGYTEVSIFLNRSRKDLPIADVKASLS
jgi:histidinol-phosphatase (PHP family)